MNSAAKTMFLYCCIAAFGVSSNCQSQMQAVLDMGEPASEAAHHLVADYSEAVGYRYPDYWFMNVRASGWHEGHEPYYVLDGNPDTCWQVSGPPKAPMVRGQWVEIELNRAIRFDELTVHWLGDEPYAFKVYEKPFSDLRRLQYEGKSRGQSAEPETYPMGKSIQTRAIRIEFAVDAGGRTQGIREIRVGGLKWPDAYPQAVHPDAGIEPVRRIYYLEFERLRTWTVFNLKRPLADGGAARRILHRDDAFEGGWIDFDIAVDPGRKNWITLRLWESHEKLMTEHGNTIVLQILEGGVNDRARWFLPTRMTEEKNWAFEWYGLKPQPGRFAYASYALPQELTEGKTKIRLRLQGVGNVRRDHPMRGPTPPIYSVISHTDPFFEAGKSE